MGDVERRACRRFTVPDAVVTSASVRRFLRGDRGERDCRLMDLSRGGARFLARHEYASRAHVDLEIAVPEAETPLRVSGRVAWCWLQPGERYAVAVEFAPYGPGKDANDPEALRRIEALESLHDAPAEDASGDTPPR